jgi:hypothetical protein
VVEVLHSVTSLPELSRTLSVYAIVAACKLLMTAKMTAVEIMGVCDFMKIVVVCFVSVEVWFACNVRAIILKALG